MNRGKRSAPRIAAVMHRDTTPSSAGAAALLAAAALALALSSWGAAAQASVGPGCQTIAGHGSARSGATGSWPFPNGNVANTRDAAGSRISSSNIGKLAQVWAFKLTGKATTGVKPYGALTANPIIEDGIVYIQDLDSDVYALSLANGKLVWEYRCDQPEKSGPGPNGVAVSGGRVYGLTPTASFALNARNGRELWVNSGLLHRGEGTFGIQPQAVGGRVYIASQYGSGAGGGVLMALSAQTGKLLWRFATLTGPDPGVKALGVGGGGAWETPLVGADGSVTYGIGNPYQTPDAAIAEPARLLYTDSDVNLDAATGKLHWYFQAVPNDFKDYDLQTSPIATEAGGTAVLLASGKMGYVYELNASTGKLLWKVPVGRHNGHDNDSLDALEHHSTIRAPLTILPGSLGGVLTNLAVADNSVYVATLDVPLTYASLKLPLATKGTGVASGEVEALNLTTGKVEWDRKLAQLPLGAITVSNDLILTTLYGGELLALNRSTGASVFERRLPAATNSPIAVAGKTVVVPAGAPTTTTGRRNPQVVAYAVP
jgi:outer membrane protein assembly factor BamB